MFRKSILASTLSLLLVPGAAWALGLGGIRPESALNQPFVGEIELVGANPDELDAVKVVLASEAEFGKRGTERQHHLTKLRFKPQVSARGKTVVRVTSTEPIREPYMDFLVEVIWPKGRLVKGYTVLLNPAVTARQSPPAVERPVAERSAPAAAPAARREAATAPAVSAPMRSATPPAAPAEASGGFPLRSGPVKQGTGLWRVARNMAPAGATVTQTAMALYRNNPDAFIQGNINRLRQGAVLQIPTSAELFAMDAAAANREFRSALSGKHVTAKPLTDVTAAAPEEAARLRIAGAAQDVAQPTPPAEGQASPATGRLATPDIEQELLLVRETGESTRQETDELRARVRQLETNLTDIQQLLTLRNAELARLQTGGATPIPSEVPLEAALSDTVLAQAQPPAGGPGVEVEGASAPGVPPEVAGGPGQVAEPPAATEAQPAAATEPGAPQLSAGPAGAGAEGTRPEKSGVSAAKGRTAKAPSVPPEEPETSWLDGVPLLGGVLKAMPAPVLWVASVAVPALGVLGWLSVRRRRRIEDDLKEFALSRPLAAKAQDAAVSAPNPDAAAASRPLGSTPAPRPEARGADIPDLGPIEELGNESELASEADIYIAYGRYRDAEELLKQAIARAPRHAELRYKLADVYADAGNREELTKLAEEMELAGMDQANPERWSRLVAQIKAVRAHGEVPTTPGGMGRAAAGAGLNLGGLAFGGSGRGALRGGDSPVDPGDFSIDRGLTTPAGGRSMDSGDSLFQADIGSQDLTLGTRELDPGPMEIVQGLPGGRQPFSAPVSARTSSADLELTLADLTTATDLNFAALGGGMPGSSPAEPPVRSTLDLDLDRGHGIARDIAFDSEPTVELIQDTQMVSDDLGAGWAAPKPFVGQPAPDSESGPDTAGFEIGPLDEGIGSSDLLSSQWEMGAGLWDEVATKLDLGRAYVEMDDREAAESILREVAEEGKPEQQDEARALLARLKPN
jgi:pilus assembly protein FimV